MSSSFGMRKCDSSRKKQNKPLDLSFNIDVQTIVSKPDKDKEANSTQARIKLGSAAKSAESVTLWDVLLSELNIVSEKDKKDQVNNQNLIVDTDSWSENFQTLLNYIRLPLHLEQFMTFGILYSTVVFLKWLVIIPLRCFIHTLINLRKLINGHPLSLFSEKRSLMYKNDLLSVSGIIITLFLLKNIDTSKIYHNIRAGTAIKLYFMTQVLDIADRLLSASGQDILIVTHKFNNFRKNNKLDLNKVSQFVCLYLLSVLYLWFHSYALIYQVMALNVAINSYSNALLTLILSNQFSELKSAVFKKTEREGLFQNSCADLNERFLIFIMLGIISSRNLLQILINTESLSDFFESLTPNSWSTQLTSWKSINNWIGLIIGPSIFVIGSEFLVDWIKYAYILRFNKIKPKVYDKFTKILASDFISGFKSDKFNKINHQPNDHPNLLTKRTGFPISTIMIIFCRLSIFPYSQYLATSVYERTDHNYLLSWVIISAIILFVIAVLVSLRLILSFVILRWSKKILLKTNNNQRNTDFLKGDPNVNLSHVSDVREHFYDETESVPLSLEEYRLEKLAKNKDNKLNNVVRFDMADKRIW